MEVQLAGNETVGDRMLRIGERLQAAGHCPATTAEPKSVRTPGEVTLAIDGGFVRSQRTTDAKSFEILTGRVSCPGKTPYVFPWVRSEGGSMQERLTGVLRSKTAAPAPQVTVITDGGTGVQHLHRLLPGRVRCVLDGFHVSMRMRRLKQIVAGLRDRTGTEHCTKRLLAEYLAKLHWHFWHASAEKAWDKLWRILTLCRIVVPETAGFGEGLQHLTAAFASSSTTSATARSRCSTTASATGRASQASASRCAGRREGRTC